MASSKFELETIFKGKDLGLSKMLNRQIRLQRKLNSLKGRAEKQARAARTLQSASTKGLIGLGAGAIAGAAGIFKITEAGREFDSEMSKEILGLFEKMNQQGKTIILATHSSEILREKKYRRLSLNQGKLLQLN